MVGVAKPMVTVVFKRGLPEIVNGTPIEIGKYADLIHGMRTTFWMNLIVG